LLAYDHLLTQTSHGIGCMYDGLNRLTYRVMPFGSTTRAERLGVPWPPHADQDLKTSRPFSFLRCCVCAGGANEGGSHDITPVFGILDG